MQTSVLSRACEETQLFKSEEVKVPVLSQLKLHIARISAEVKHNTMHNKLAMNF